jgi:predicted transcriptional regulator
MDTQDNTNFSDLTAEIVAAYVSNNNVRPEELASLIESVHSALKQAPNGKTEPQPEPQQPAVPIRKSVTPDYIISLEDGRKFKSLKRHLKNPYGMTPDEYRAKWGLPRDYPMVAPSYAKARSDLAKTMGLGRKAAPEPVRAAPAASTAKRTRRTKAAA